MIEAIKNMAMLISAVASMLICFLQYNNEYFGGSPLFWIIAVVAFVSSSVAVLSVLAED